MSYEVIDTDVLVVGAGGAGARAAIEAARQNVRVTVVTKELFGKAHTTMAEGGYNAPLGNADKGDTWMAHYHDTISGGAWINDQSLVEVLIKEAPDRIFDLEEFGAIFDRTADGKIRQRPFGKQSYTRTCYASDRTGHEMMTTLVEENRRLGVEVYDETFATKLLKDQDTVSGAIVLDIKSGQFKAIRAKATVIATGGAGRLYEISTNALSDTGDGYALGLDAGAELIDMEMVQFHPTGMIYPESCVGVLVTEAVRGEGGILYNKNGDRFMLKYGAERVDLSGRDEVSRAIATEILDGRGTEKGGVYLDVSHLPAYLIEERLPSMLEQFEKIGVDIRKEPMEIAPTAHHFMGGLKIDTNGQTTVKQLFSAGEAAGGVHGGNRLGGNALADTQVFGRRAGLAAATSAKKRTMPKLDKNAVEKEVKSAQSIIDRKDGTDIQKLKRDLKRLMWDKVGIYRTGQELQDAINALHKWIKEDVPQIYVRTKSTRYNREWVESIELYNMLVTAEVVARAALMREESRGAHSRRDFPKTDNKNWFVNIIATRSGTQIDLSTKPVPTTLIPHPGMAFNEVKWP